MDAADVFLHATAGVEAWLDDPNDHPDAVVSRGRRNGDLIGEIARARLWRMRFVSRHGDVWDPRRAAFSTFPVFHAWEEEEPILTPEEVRAWLG
ncbi:MAG: hypothetical protein D6760_10810 [Deltaproteobacteria bacterium]|nr:MAG: hypothetical protein D6760_10810 [Deltaproteobacteria bacterium]